MSCSFVVEIEILLDFTFKIKFLVQNTLEFSITPEEYQNVEIYDMPKNKILFGVVQLLYILTLEKN